MSHTDTELLNWLEERGGCALVSDDAGRWCVSDGGLQNMPDADKPIDIWNAIFVEAADWRDSIRLALEAAISSEVKEQQP